MKKYLSFFLPIIFIFVFYACDPTGSEEPATDEDKYLVSYTDYRLLSSFEIDLILGTLKNQYPEIETLDAVADLSVWIYSIEYKTTFQENEITASGLVCVPIPIEDNEGPFPIMSFQNGTNVLHANAPSVNPDYDLYKFLESVSSAGFILAIPDYLGFGASSHMFHPYLDAESTTQSLIDMIRATKELMAERNLDINASDDLYIAGYSQGGWSTLQLQKEIETNYSDEFDLKASACGAGPYNLLLLNSYVMGLESYPMPYFIGYMLSSYSKLGSISNSLDEIFNEPYAGRVSTMYNGENDSGYLNSQLTNSVSALFTQAYLNGWASSGNYASLRTTLLNNGIEPWNISTPLLLAHGKEDTFVPSQASVNMYNDILELGVSESKVTLQLVDGVDHQEGILPIGVSIVNWFLQLKNQ